MAGVVQHRPTGGIVSAPPRRDLFMDLLRLVALAVVVVLHWLSVMPELRDGVVVDRNVVEVTVGLWPFTWFAQVMALFFFVGGYANWVSLTRSAQRGETWTRYLIRRFDRLIRPTLALFAAWFALDVLARVVGHGELSPLAHVTIGGNTIPFGPLWFVGVYLVVIALSPLTTAAHLRWRVGVVVAMVAAVAVADAVAFATGTPWIMAANVVLVWSVPHQLGYFYADGSLGRLRPADRAAMAGLGLLGILVLTSLPCYPRSLITLPWTVSVIGTPTLAQVCSAFWLVGLALLLQPWAQRLLDHDAARRLVDTATPLAMPVYLWHMTAYLIGGVVLAWLGADFVFGIRTDPGWWWTRPVLVSASAAVLAVLLWVARAVSSHRRATQRGPAPAGPSRRSTAHRSVPWIQSTMHRSVPWIQASSAASSRSGPPIRRRLGRRGGRPR